MENTRYKILLIEDDKLDQMAFKQLVEDEKLPYDCTIAGSVSQAQSILGSETFDVVIVDYQLGDGTAFDILDLVKNTPIIFVTGAGNEEIATKAWKVGACDYLIKDHERNYLKAVPITVENAIKHKKMEEQVQLLSGAIMSTEDSVYITDMKGRIIFVNETFCETYGYKEEDVVGKEDNILWEENLSSKTIRGISEGVESGWAVAFYHRRKDGSEFPVSLSRSIVKDESGKEIAIVGVSRDISERTQIENKLRASNLELKGRNWLKSGLAIMACRQLMALVDEFDNTISNAVMATPGEISSKLRENLELAEKDIDRAKRIIGDFLDVSKIDAAKMKLKRAEFSFCSAVSQVLKALAPLAAEKNIELKSFMPDCELVVNADYDRMVQVLTNLISNSINSVPANGHISVRVKDAGNEIVVEVQDDGPSIESSEIDKIFNRFAQIERWLRTDEEDLALGLPIAKELLQMQGGCVWVESADASRGNNFCFTLPKASVREAVASAAVEGERRCEN